MGTKSLCAAFALLLSACAQGVETNAMRTIVKAGFSGIQEAGQFAVTNQAAWDALWRRHSARVEPKPPAPEVDLAKETVLAVAMGQRRSGGYGIEITGVSRHGDDATVTYRGKTPKPGAIGIQAITSPIHIVAVPRIAGGVTFKAVE